MKIRECLVNGLNEYRQVGDAIPIDPQNRDIGKGRELYMGFQAVVVQDESVDVLEGLQRAQVTVEGRV